MPPKGGLPAALPFVARQTSPAALYSSQSNPAAGAFPGPRAWTMRTSSLL